MMKYFIIIMLITMIFMFTSKLNMMNVIFQNLLILVLIMFLVEYSFISLNLMDYFGMLIFYGLDFFSYWMIVLSFWIIILMMISSIKIVKMKKFLLMFIVNLLIMLLMLMMTFSSLNLLTFYLLFEASLIPTLFLILGWGYQVERIQAGMYMMLYTLFSSLPLLFMLIYLYKNLNSIDMVFMNYKKINLDSWVCYFILLMAFLVKMPMFMVHSWLPKAHVEAPVAGSMILAGVMLKMGGYGIYRLMFVMEHCFKYNIYIMVFSLVGGIYLSLVCLRQVDMKSMVAYSSVVHMSMVISSIMTTEFIGIQGAYLMMIAHGICSSGLFCIVNMMYEQTNSRSLIFNKGMLIFNPSMMMMWFLLCIGNMSAPPSLNLFSEIYMLISLLSWETMLLFLLILLMFFSSCYSLYLYSYVCYGKSLVKFSFGTFSSREYMLMILHLIPLNIMILKVEIFI